jgi:hypothetical protein
MEPEASQLHSQVVEVTYRAETWVINKSAEKKNINDLWKEDIKETFRTSALG